MTDAPARITQLVRTALGRDPAPGEDPAPEPAMPPEPKAEEPEFDEGLLAILGEKVLRAWLRNRYQLLFPFALDLRRLDEGQAALLLHAMIAAAEADGSLDPRERERIAGTLRLVDPDGDAEAALEAALAGSKSLNAILAEVHDVQAGALVYAAALMAVDRRQPVNRHFLRYLAARLQLSEELAGSLEQRYR
jgi:uncharacterized membrane protein YebE (DUF533 family)